MKTRILISAVFRKTGAVHAAGFVALLWAWFGAPVLADPVAPAAAQEVVRGWLAHGARPLGAALGGDVERVVPYEGSAGQAAWYVVYLRPAGFVIVPADDWLEPILAFVPRGKFDPSPRHPLGALVAADLRHRLVAVRQARQALAAAPLPAAYRAHREQWRALQAAAGSGRNLNPFTASISDERVPPLVGSAWDQESEGGANDYCYNYFTPNHDPCGCGPTAAAQLLRYHQYPAAGVGARSFEVTVENDPNPYWTLTLKGGDGAGGPYNWSAMPLDPDENTPAAQRQAIGALCHDVGAAAQARYGPLSTSTDFFTVAEIMKSVFYYRQAIAAFNNYESISAAALVSMLNPNLDAGLPTLLGIDGDYGGHAVVCDGYGYDHGTLYHHVNLGWGAYYSVANAWYALPLVDPPAATFTAVIACLYNVYPSGSGEIISGRITDSTARPLAGATVFAELAGSGSRAVASDSRGIYAFSRLPADTEYTLRVEKTGYAFSARTAFTGHSGDYQNGSGNQWGVDFVGSGGVGPDPDPANQPAAADYDGDGRADPAIYVPVDGRWYVWLSSRNYVLSGPHSFGVAGYTNAVPADYDGDGRADPAVCGAATGDWFVWLSGAGYAGVGAAFSRPGFSLPAPADYDGDGRADPAAFNPSSGEWYVWLSSVGYAGSGPHAFTYQDYAIPAPADFDGDRQADPALFSAAAGKWSVWLSVAGYAPAGPYGFGESGYAAPAPADYDGDRLADPGVFSAAAGSWYVWLSASGYARVGPVAF